MQLGLSALLAAATAAVTVSAQYSGYFLTADPGQNLPKINSLWTTVSVYNSSLWIGDAKTDPSSEPFICQDPAFSYEILSNMLTGILL